MFTGLIEAKGTVLGLRQVRGATRIIIAAPSLAGRWKIGDSIAVNGVCLTAIDLEELDERHPGRFAADLATETIERTTLTSLIPGALVNLELPTPAGHPLGGHVVQGHVDSTGSIVSLVPLHEDLHTTDWRLTIEVPMDLVASIIPQGSITIDGISLTVARVSGRQIEIAVIPHTYRSTNLHSLMAGTRVNLETDILSRYAAQHIAHASEQDKFEAQKDLRAQTKHEAPSTWSISDADAAVSIKAASSDEWLTVEALMSNGY